MNSHIKLAIMFFAVTLMTACTTYYTHPTKKQEFMLVNDRNECTAQSERNNCQQYGPSSTTNCIPNALTGGVDCFTNTSPGGTRCVADSQQVKSCLLSKGWRVTDKDGNYK